VDDALLLPDVTSIQISPPTPLNIGRATGFQVDLAPDKSMERRVPVVPDTGYQLDPGHTYRLIVTQLLMGEESAKKVILISAPTAAWSSFLPVADSVVQTIRLGVPQQVGRPTHDCEARRHVRPGPCVGGSTARVRGRSSSRCLACG
jgi:hypothetical protein